MVVVRRENFGKETFWKQTSRGWKFLGAAETPCSNTQCEGGDDAERWSQNHNPGGRWTSKATWRRSSSENIHFITGSSRRCSRRAGRRNVLQETKCEKTFVENQMGLSQCDSFPGEGHHVESEIQFDVPKSTSRPITNGLGRNSPPVRVHFTA